MNGKKWISASIAAAMAFSISAVPAHAQWDGNNHWIDNGAFATGWRYIEDAWYYFSNTGEMVKGWTQDSSQAWYLLDYETGKMKTGWIAANSTDWYYLNPANGIMQAKTWVESDGTKYYFDEHGIMVRGNHVIDGYNYVFQQNGAFVSKGDKSDEVDETKKNGWVKEGTQFYYYKNDVKQSGWLTLGEKKYYLGGSDNRMLIGTQKIDGKTYTFAQNGVLLSEGGSDTDYADAYSATEYRTDKSKLVDYLNDERDYEKLDELSWVRSDGLDKAAYIRANELVDDFSYDRPNGKSLDDLMDDLKLDYDMVEEHFVKAASPKDALRELFNDRWAERDILNEDFNEIAVGIAKDSNDEYVYVILLTDGGSGTGVSGYDYREYRTDKREILGYLNDYRKSDKVDSLTLAYNDELDKAAYKRAVEIASKFSDTRPNGKDYETVLDDFKVDYNSSYELIYKDEDDYETIVDEWMDVRADKRAIVDEDYKNVGIGIVEDGKHTYVVVLLVEPDTSLTYSSTAYRTDKLEIMNGVNDYRSGTALTKVTSGNLDKYAFQRVVQVAQGKDKDDIEDFLDDLDYDYGTYAYEIIVKDDDDIDYVIDEITDDSAVDNTRYKKIAVGAVEYKKKMYWVVLLTQK